MKKTTQLLTLAITLCNSHSISAMKQEPKTHLIVIPGQNGMGGQNVDTVLPYFTQQMLKHDVSTPIDKPDFGQTNCLNLLKEKINFLKDEGIVHKDDHFLIHGSSQGTATTINYAANNPDNIKGLILESVMLTGNSAIFHTCEKVMLPQITATIEELPNTSYYTLPYTAKSLYPAYSPIGEQPIFNVGKLPDNLPIIILHDTQDFQLSFKDAQGLYAFLTQIHNNKNVYLFAQESKKGKHINLLTAKHTKEIAAITTILKRHNILPFNAHDNLTIELNDLKEYQPDVQQEWLDHFYTIVQKEDNLKWASSSTTWTSSKLSACIVM